MSEAIFHNGQWWQQNEAGTWWLFDEAGQKWIAWEDAGTPPEDSRDPTPVHESASAPTPSVPTNWDPAGQVDALANQKLNMRLGVSKELRTLPAYLNENEQVLNLSSGMYDGHNGLIVLTDKRVMFLAASVMKTRFEDFPYNKISSVQHSTGMVFGELTIFASGNKAQMVNMIKDRAKEIGEYVRKRLTAGDTPTTGLQPIQAPQTDDPYAQLKKLGELRDAGVFTSEEFEEQKRHILSRMSAR